LLLAGALEGPIRKLAERRKVADISRLVSGRAETIYLWHPAAIVVAFAVTQHGPAVAIVAITVVLTAVATVAVGWVEDLAGGGELEAAAGGPLPGADPTRRAGPRHRHTVPGPAGRGVRGKCGRRGSGRRRPPALVP
jgi:hypothetical protein